ncbi:hypothetical protein THAOC_24212 [Thalassiosira oceanica]|uniref:START domain-containing protein n=1 Tax=Thalassiosira oceanica TaxID=159749 RepID=K0S4X1_THAOC|nr:hypothetical protein THAOC_24212 [Thalassiosira oceanica]|eukprot:EJK55981.1 hypothetical protein THAOC_24212 [Thalassiosira oceanica]
MQILLLLPILLLVSLGSAFQGRRVHTVKRSTPPPPRVRLHRVSHADPTLVLRRTSNRFLADDDDNDAAVYTDSIGEPRQKRLIECSAAIVLPFSTEVAFAAFSDLSRQPSWCRYLSAVEYVGVLDDDGCSTDDGDCSPLRSSRGFTFSWLANDTCIQRPNGSEPGFISWESTSGLKNYGSVLFEPIEEDNGRTRMDLKFQFKAPRVVSGLFRREPLLNLNTTLRNAACTRISWPSASIRRFQGAQTSISRKHKINTRSSTESELVGADDILPSAIWSKYFIEAQGFTVDRNIMYQDNQSAMLLENNGKFSSSKRTKHINNRYFLIKDKIEQGDLETEYCPTEKMWSDGHTKPKQGEAFRIDRAAVMNCPVDYFEDENEHDDVDCIDGHMKPDSCSFIKINGNRISVGQ